MEKRRFSRIFLDVKGRLTVENESYEVERIANLSVGGCLLEIDCEHLLNKECTFTILLSRMAPGIEVFGEIVRAEKGELSVQFNRIEPEHLFHLQNVIRYNSPDPEKIEKEIQERPGLK